VNRLPVNRITGYVTRDRFQLTVTDTRKSNCDLRHLAVGRDTSVDRKQIMIKSVHRSRCRRLMSIKVLVVTTPNLQRALSTDAALGLPLPRPTPTQCLTGGCQVYWQHADPTKESCTHSLRIVFWCVILFMSSIFFVFFYFLKISDVQIVWFWKSIISCLKSIFSQLSWCDITINSAHI